MKALIVLALTISVAVYADEGVRKNISAMPPQRDDLGDILNEFDAIEGNWTGITFDGELLWGMDTDGGRMISVTLEGEIVDTFYLPLERLGIEEDAEETFSGICWDGESLLVGCAYIPKIFKFNRRGALIGRRDLPEHGENQGAWGIAWDGENIWYTLAGGDGTIYQMTPLGEFIRQVDCSEIDVDGEQVSIVWAPAHFDGHMWWHAGNENYLAQLNVENDEAEVISELEIGQENTFGLTHDGENLWYQSTNMDDEEWVWYQIDDGVQEEDLIPEIVIEPDEFDFGTVYSLRGRGNPRVGVINMIISNFGNDNLIIEEISIENVFFDIDIQRDVVIHPNDTLVRSVVFQPGGFGEYEGTMIIQSNDPERHEIAFDLSGSHVDATLRIINPITSRGFNEDCGIQQIADMNTVFSREYAQGFVWVDGPLELNLEISNQGILTLNPDENYYVNRTEIGYGYDGGIHNSISGDFRITIYPVNDFPSEATLLNPASESEISVDEARNLNLIWSQSYDPDLEDTVRYDITVVPSDHAGDLPGDPIYYFGICDTMISVNIIDSLSFEYWDNQIYVAVLIDAISNEDTVSMLDRFFIGENVEVAEHASNLPSDIALTSVYPNPFNSSTTIEYSLPVKSDITLQVFDTYGNQVWTLYNGKQPAGTHSIELNSSNLPSGLYFVRLNARDQIFSKKIILIR